MVFSMGYDYINYEQGGS